MLSDEIIPSLYNFNIVVFTPSSVLIELLKQQFEIFSRVEKKKAVAYTVLGASSVYVDKLKVDEEGRYECKKIESQDDEKLNEDVSEVAKEIEESSKENKEENKDEENK